MRRKIKHNTGELEKVIVETCKVANVVVMGVVGCVCVSVVVVFSVCVRVCD